MKRKSAFYVITVVLVLLAVYGIWHYSPLRHLTRSRSGSDQIRTASVRSQNQPIIVTKRILPEPSNTQQTGDLPRPLVVLKQISPQDTSQPVKPPKKSADLTAAEEKTPQAVSEDSLSAKVSAPQAAQLEKPLKPQPAPKQAASLGPKSVYPYSIMLSSCRLPQSARKIVSDYKKVGLTPYVVKVKFGSGDEWLRVLAGHYQTRREALKVKQEHRLSKAIVKRTPYTNLISTYPSMDKMQTDLRRIKALGYSPYFLKTKDGQFKLVVGAFVTKEGAENQQAELQAKGIQNIVIIR